MIAFNPDTRTFNLNLKRSFYAFQVDAEGRLFHLGWGPRPAGTSAEAGLAGEAAYLNYETPVSFLVQFQPYELPTFGDLALYEPTLKAGFPALARPLAADEAAHLPIRDLRLRYVGHRVVTDAAPGYAPQHGQPAANPAPRETLQVRLTDPGHGLQVTACYRLTPEHDILERWLELENLGRHPVTFEVCYSASLYLPAGTTELTYVSGTWAREFTTQRERLAPGLKLIESRSLQTGHVSNPFFLLNRPGQAWEETGVVYFGALAYSGSWRLAFEQLPTHAVRVHGGYNFADDRLELAPGERHVTPAFVTGLSPDGWGGASRRLHAFTQERVLPAPARPTAWRPVLYNSWEATYFNLSIAGQIELARKAAAIGVELFCVDDGWFGARRDDTAGLGDWTVRADAFPEGLEPLVREVHRLGMKFGLWIEPEMVNPDSDLYRQHPDWVLHFPGRPRTEARHQLILDLGRPEVVAHLFNVLDSLVDRYQVAFFKWDMNRLATEPGSAAGRAIWRRHVEGVYGLMDRLRRKHPGLDIQSCSGGGGRIDLGVLARTDQAWVSDNTDALDRIRIQEGFSLAYPARCMEAWVTHERNPITRRVTDLSLRFDVAMRGVLGIGSSLNELGEAELAEYARYIAFYKRLRPIIQTGRLYRLQRLEECDASVIEYVLPDGREAVYSVVLRDQQVGRLRPPTPLRGLNAGAAYQALDRHGRAVHRASGYELMTLGLPVEACENPNDERLSEPAGYSRTLHLRQVD